MSAVSHRFLGPAAIAIGSTSMTSPALQFLLLTVCGWVDRRHFATIEYLRYRPTATRTSSANSALAACSITTTGRPRSGSRNETARDKDPPEGRPPESINDGNMASLPRVGGLHRRHTRLAARARVKVRLLIAPEGAALDRAARAAEVSARLPSRLSLPGTRARMRATMSKRVSVLLARSPARSVVIFWALPR